VGRWPQWPGIFAGANSIFVGDTLLTASNPDQDKDHQLLRRLGMERRGATPPPSAPMVTSVQRISMNVQEGGTPRGAQGYSIIFEELLEGANGVGVPIRSPGSDEVIGALVIGGPAFRFRLEQIERALPLMQVLARDLGNVLPTSSPGLIAEPNPRRAAADR
jgi:hypothetical protein